MLRRSLPRRSSDVSEMPTDVAGALMTPPSLMSPPFVLDVVLKLIFIIQFYNYSPQERAQRIAPLHHLVFPPAFAHSTVGVVGGARQLWQRQPWRLLPRPPDSHDEPRRQRNAVSVVAYRPQLSTRPQRRRRGLPALGELHDSGHLSPAFCHALGPFLISGVNDGVVDHGER